MNFVVSLVVHRQFQRIKSLAHQFLFADVSLDHFSVPPNEVNKAPHSSD
jgi:hypothetical protein